MLEIGTKVSWTVGQKVKHRNEGIVVAYSEATNPDYSELGCVEVWLSNQTGYGLNNCEHFHSNNYGEFLKVRQAPNSLTEFSVGRLLNTKLGKAVIVEELDEQITVFLYGENNAYEPSYVIEDSPEYDDVIDDTEDSEESELAKFYAQFDARSLADPNFNSQTHCLHLPKSELADYIVS